MNIAEKVIDIIKGMEGIGGIPTNKEFLDEFEFRLQALKQGQSLPIDSVSGTTIKTKQPLDTNEFLYRSLLLVRTLIIANGRV